MKCIILAGESVLQQTVEMAGKYVEDIYVVTNEAQYYYVKHQLDYKVREENIIIEPAGKNTAPAIALVCMIIQETCGGGKILVLPGDHLMSGSFFDTVKKADKCAEGICLFGIKPTHASTDYGYIKPGKENGCGPIAEKFIEKPDRQLANELFEEGCLWNSGIFLFDVSRMIEEFKSNLPRVYQYMGSSKELIANYHDLPNISIDSGIIEKSNQALVFPFKDDSENAKDLVEELKTNCEEVVQHIKIDRPWGYYTILEKGAMYKVKRLCILPGKSLSHQLHHHRAEHWIVVKGTAKVVKDGEESFLHENESIYVPKSIAHRIENPGKMELHIIEVQTGGYLEEDDIMRFDH